MSEMQSPQGNSLGPRFDKQPTYDIVSSMGMPTADLIAIIGSVLGVGLALAVLIMRSTARVDADRHAFQAEAAQDRRALQASMDSFRAEMDSFRADFRAEMQRLAERQSRIEGIQEVHPRGPAPAD